jgi:hypothetical protein
MERLWSLTGAISGNRWQTRRRPNPKNRLALLPPDPTNADQPPSGREIKRRDRLGGLNRHFETPQGCTNSVVDWIQPICSEIVFMQPNGNLFRRLEERMRLIQSKCVRLPVRRAADSP